VAFSATEPLAFTKVLISSADKTSTFLLALYALLLLIKAHFALPLVPFFVVIIITPLEALEP
jgi:hypothetical protein